MPKQYILSLTDDTKVKQSKGLTSKEAEMILVEHGPNSLPDKPPPSDFIIFLEQLKNPMVYVLVGASIVTFLLKEFTDTIIIFLAVLVNTVLGFFQERKAGRALEELKKLVHPHAKVLRDGKIKTIEVENIVPGDVALLSQGDKIPADGILLESNRFFVTESILTGESVPVEKEIKSEVFMGTIITVGKAKMLVVETGSLTEMGKIALSVSEEQEDTPLKKQLIKFSKQLSWLVLVLIVVVFLVGVFTGKGYAEIFTISVALAVSAIPEGLLVGLTVVLAIGMQRILKRRGLVRNLVSAETLGGVTTICADKTGTLTQGIMQVVNVVGEELDLAKQVSIANDLDDPVVIAAWEWGKGKVGSDNHLTEKYKRLDSIPFSSEQQFFVSLNHWEGDKNMVFVNGAPEVLLQNSIGLSEIEKKEIKDRIEQLSSEGKRLLGFAKKTVPSSKKDLSLSDVGNLTWVGMLAFTDPVRPDVGEALRKTRSAGIKLMIITGDYAKTALSVLSSLDIEVREEDVVLGEEVAALSEEELVRRIFSSKGNDVKLFARTKPDQKLKIVTALKKHGEVVAMMGDGVNDAPALSKADIGIVVAEASDVAKESADLVLLDSSFSTIVAAVEEGRGIFDNIRKIILYLMSDAFEEIIIVMAALILKFPLPITAAQLLWVNLVSDGFPDLALTVDPKAKGLMKDSPRSPKEPLVTGWMLKLMGIVSVVGAIFAFGLFLYALNTTGDVVFARSVAFATVGLNSLVYVFSIRTLTKPFWEEGLFENKWLIGAVFVGLIFQIIPFINPTLRSFFDIKPLGIYWLYAFLASVGMFIVIELAKIPLGKHLEKI